MPLPDSIPLKCPKCGMFLKHCNAIDACGEYFVYCMNLKCRWCEIWSNT